MLPPPLDTWCGETRSTLTQDDDDDVSNDHSCGHRSHSAINLANDNEYLHEDLMLQDPLDR